jgi:hypothetical protein
MCTLQENRKNLSGYGKSVLAALLTGLFLLLTASSGSALIHKHLHAESGDATHHCVVCLLAHGQFDSVDSAPPQAHATFTLNEPAVFARQIFKQNICLLLSASRAPPVA